MHCRQGEEGDSLYVVESGRFRATKDGAEVATYDGAGAFGELALMYNCPRAATVTGERGWACKRLWVGSRTVCLVVELCN